MASIGISNTSDVDDRTIKGPRSGNKATWLTTTALVFGGTTALGWMLTTSLFGGAVPLPVGTIGGVIGFAAGALLNLEVLKRSVVNNGAAQAFVTVDSWRSFRRKNDPFVVYGPGGPHIAKWWEQRSKENSINLNVASVNFSFTVQCSDGVLTGKGSFRLRADINNAVKYLRGYKAIADDIGELIIAHALNYLAGKSVKSASKQIAPLNEGLTKTFVEPSPSPLEKEYGVQIIDMTVTELLPSEEVQKTHAAIAEARIIKTGTAYLLGMTQKAVTEGLKNGTLSRDAYDRARERFMAVSGNLEGMTVSRQEFDINLKGIDQKTLKELVAFGRQLGLGAKQKGNDK